MKCQSPCQLKRLQHRDKLTGQWYGSHPDRALWRAFVTIHIYPARYVQFALFEVYVAPTSGPLLARRAPVEPANSNINRNSSSAASIRARMASLDGGTIFFEPSPREPITLTPCAAFVATQSSDIACPRTECRVA